MRSSLKVAAAALLAAGCGSKLPATSSRQSSAVIGSAGGTVVSADGIVAVTIPPGALTSDVTISVAPTTSPGAPTISQAYEIGPTGTEFATPATILFHFGSLNLAGTSATSLQLATFAGGWLPLQSTVSDEVAKTIAGTTTHLSLYAIVAPGGPVCATVSGGLTCVSSGPGSSGTGAGGSNSNSTGTSLLASDTVICTPNACADAGDVCGPYGAKMTGCTDGPDGYTATCCSPAGSGICMPTSGIQGGGFIYSPDGGVTTVSLPKPTCATATDPCSQYPGATLQSCNDNATGFTGTCCFPPNQPVCILTTSGGCTNPTPAEATSCNVIFSCANTSPADFCPYGSTGTCADRTDEIDITCCYPLGVLPSNGTPASALDGGAGSGGISGAGGLTGGGGLGGLGGRGGGTGGFPNGETGGRPGTGGISDGNTGGIPGTGGMFGAGQGGTG